MIIYNYIIVYTPFLTSINIINYSSPLFSHQLIVDLPINSMVDIS